MNYVIDERANAILTDVIKRVRSISGGPGIRVSNTPNGITISAEAKPQTPGSAPSVAVGGVLTPLTTIGANSEGSETADTGTWTRGDHAVEVWAVSRVVYNEAGDKVLYAMVRKWTYDTLGALYSISAETRISVDATDACP